MGGRSILLLNISREEYGPFHLIAVEHAPRLKGQLALLGVQLKRFLDRHCRGRQRLLRPMGALQMHRWTVATEHGIRMVSKRSNKGDALAALQGKQALILQQNHRSFCYLYRKLVVLLRIQIDCIFLDVRLFEHSLAILLFQYPQHCIVEGFVRDQTPVESLDQTFLEDGEAGKFNIHSGIEG